MTELTRIQDQLQRAYDGDAWHGPPLRTLLADVTAPQAAARPIPAAHSIWEIVLHVIAWERVVVRRLAGQVVELPEQENWPPIPDKSEAAWKATQDDLEAAHRQLATAIEHLDGARLNDMVPGKGHTVYVMLHGVIQHNLYHAGQIAVLKKA
jgi:uncharacterized damage-inducible protein DinB